VVQFGIAAPMPSPVRNRNAARMGAVPAYADARLAALKTRTEAIRTRLRPILSAIGPAMSAPIARPTRAALSTGPSASFEIESSCVRAGATKAIAAVSKPSAIRTKKQRTRMIHCIATMERSSMKVLTSRTTPLRIGAVNDIPSPVAVVES